jgi:hypothetical protein
VFNKLGFHYVINSIINIAAKELRKKSYDNFASTTGKLPVHGTHSTPTQQAKTTGMNHFQQLLSSDFIFLLI